MIAAASQPIAYAASDAGEQTQATELLNHPQRRAAAWTTETSIRRSVALGSSWIAIASAGAVVSFRSWGTCPPPDQQGPAELEHGSLVTVRLHDQDR
jgi:hypothetical protein